MTEIGQDSLLEVEVVGDGKEVLWLVDLLGLLQAEEPGVLVGQEPQGLLEPLGVEEGELEVEKLRGVLKGFSQAL